MKVREGGSSEALPFLQAEEAAEAPGSHGAPKEQSRCAKGEFCCPHGAGHQQQVLKIHRVQLFTSKGQLLF